MPAVTSKIVRRTSFSLMGAAFALCLSCSHGWADELPAVSHVTAATIFPDRAIVTWLAKLHVAAGAHTIVISDVPAGLDESSLRVQGNADNGEKFPLLPGRVAKYRDNAFIGNAMLPILRPGETVQLAFGVDDRVKVSYRRTHEEQSNPTFIVVGDVTIERQYETKIQNLHKDPIDIMVFEQYPTAANPDVKAELEDGVTTAGFARDPDNRQGIITWSANLKPQEEKTYTLGFQVKYPKNEQLTGL